MALETAAAVILSFVKKAHFLSTEEEKSLFQRSKQKKDWHGAADLPNCTALHQREMRHVCTIKNSDIFTTENTFHKKLP